MSGRAAFCTRRTPPPRLPRSTRIYTHRILTSCRNTQYRRLCPGEQSRSRRPPPPAAEAQPRVRILGQILQRHACAHRGRPGRMGQGHRHGRGRVHDEALPPKIWICSALRRPLPSCSSKPELAGVDLNVYASRTAKANAPVSYTTGAPDASK